VLLPSLLSPIALIESCFFLLPKPHGLPAPIPFLPHELLADLLASRFGSPSFVTILLLTRLNFAQPETPALLQYLRPRFARLSSLVFLYLPYPTWTYLYFTYPQPRKDYPRRSPKSSSLGFITATSADTHFIQRMNINEKCADRNAILLSSRTCSYLFLPGAPA
jgi:hypothetical protein